MNFKTLDAETVFSFHEEILTESIGLPGICPHKSLEAALHRVDNLVFYEGVEDLFEIAACYGIVVAQGHIAAWLINNVKSSL